MRDKFDPNARDRFIALLRQRYRNAEIAIALHLTLGTVKVYVHELLEKLDVHSRGELLAILDSTRRQYRQESTTGSSPPRDGNRKASRGL